MARRHQEACADRLCAASLLLLALWLALPASADEIHRSAPAKTSAATAEAKPLSSQEILDRLSQRRQHIDHPANMAPKPPAPEAAEAGPGETSCKTVDGKTCVDPEAAEQPRGGHAAKQVGEAGAPDRSERPRVEPEAETDAPADTKPDPDWEDWDQDAFSTLPSGGGRHRSSVSRGSSGGPRRQTAGPRPAH